MSLFSAQTIQKAVQSRYAKLAGSGDSCCDSQPTCMGEEIYESDLSSVPSRLAGASLGCGDPIAIASLKPGHVVLDLGSGAGLDCFLAAREVGPEGRVIGVDMTPEMIEKANANRDSLGLANVEFRQGVIEELPVAADSVDVIISNCVINLSTDKDAVLREAWRVLKPGGRLAVSDLVAYGTLNWARRTFLEAWSGCMAGAETIEDLHAKLAGAGFEGISIQNRKGDPLKLFGEPSQPGTILSARIEARKPL